MNTKALIGQLRSGGGVIAALYADLQHDELHWRPAPGKWSLLEVLCHLADEEREDFRTRLRLTLEQEGRAWPPNDPEGWVETRAYSERDPAEALSDFTGERAVSIAWLTDLTTPDWTVTHTHSKGYVISAGDLLLSWVVHDAAHLRQIANLRLGHAEAMGKPFSSDYAGA